MHLEYDNKKPILVVGEKKIVGKYRQNDGYYGCRNIFDLNTNDLTLNEISTVIDNNFPENTYICSAYTSDTYTYIEWGIIFKAEDALKFFLSATFSWDTWNEDINLKLFIPKLTEHLKSQGQYRIKSVSDEKAEYFIELEGKLDPHKSLGDSLEEISEFLAECHTNSLYLFKSTDDFISQFNFPHEYRSIFIQYLTYFGKFLEDLGINGNISIINDGDITKLQYHSRSTNKESSIDDVLSALAVYLNLPSSNNSEMIRFNDDYESQIRFQQLVATVQHLESQLNLSKALVSLKEREIETLEHKIKTTEREESASIDISDYWEPISGIKITEYKGKFFSIDIPKIINKLKDKNR